MTSQDDFIEEVVEAISRHIDDCGLSPYQFADELICLMEEHDFYFEEA